MKSLSNKISYIVLALMMFAIIISFAFTGFEGFSGGSNTVATVDGTPVTRQEYNMAFNALTKRMSPEKSLTSKQIKDFKLREQALQQVIEQKHILNFADKLGFEPSQAELKEEIKSMPYFKTGESFDVNKYKQLLAANSLTPAKFELQVKEQLKTQKMQELLSAGIFSQSFVEERVKFQNLQAQGWLVSFDKEEMTKYIDISASEVTSFSSNEKNKKTIESLYKTYEGRMTFEKKKVLPLKSVKDSLVKNHLQKTKRKELSQLHEKVKDEALTLMQGNNLSGLKRLKNKYGLNLQTDFTLSPLSANLPHATVKLEEILPLFKSKNTEKVITKDEQTHVTLLKLKDFTSKKITDEELNKQIESSSQFAFYTLQSSILKFAKDNAKVTTKVDFN